MSIRITVVAAAVATIGVMGVPVAVAGTGDKLEFGRGDTSGGGSWRLLAYRNRDDALCVDARVTSPGSGVRSATVAHNCGSSIEPACGRIGMASFSYLRSVSADGELGRGEVTVSGPVARVVSAVRVRRRSRSASLNTAGKIARLSRDQADALDTRPLSWYVGSFYPAPANAEVRAVALRRSGKSYRRAAVYRQSRFACAPAE